jgi:hypothetical protein
MKVMQTPAISNNYNLVKHGEHILLTFKIMVDKKMRVFASKFLNFTLNL